MICDFLSKSLARFMVVTRFGGLGISTSTLSRSFNPAVNKSSCWSPRTVVALANNVEIVSDILQQNPLASSSPRGFPLNGGPNLRRAVRFELIPLKVSLLLFQLITSQLGFT